MPLCSTCHTVKPPAEFYSDRTRSTQVSSRCKTCEREYLRARYSAHSEAERARVQAWREANAERVREANREYDRSKRKRKETGR